MTLQTDISCDPAARGPIAEIRPARWGDKDKLLHMIHALAHHHGDEAELDMPALIDLMRADLPWLKLLVAEIKGELVGYAGLVGGVTLHHGQRKLDLHHLYICEEARGHGVGRALIDAAQQEAEQLGCHRLTVSTSDQNRAAQAAYVACGFEPQDLRGKRFAMFLG